VLTSRIQDHVRGSITTTVSFKSLVWTDPLQTATWNLLLTKNHCCREAARRGPRCWKFCQVTPDNAKLHHKYTG